MTGKNNLPPKDSFKVPSIRIVIAAGFQRQERFLPNKSQGPLETMGKYLSIPARKSSGESFVTVFFFFPVAPKMVQVCEEKALE